MTATKFTGPLGTYTQLQTGAATSFQDLGFAVMSQFMVIVQNSTNAVTQTVYLPQGSQITQFLVDVQTSFNSVTSAILTIGTQAAGTQYVTSVDVKAGSGRTAVALTAAQVTAMANITTNVGVYATVTPVGATSAGTVQVTVQYVQQPQSGDNP